MEKEQITSIAKSILSLDVNDGIQFQFQRIETIREDDVYNNFRVHMDARYGKINSPMKIDIATGDEITPSAVCYDYPFLFEQKSVPIMAYTLETILAEKYETILRRNEVRPEILRQAIQHTSKNVVLLPNLKNGRTFYRT
ncbi:MAG: nucleotidyl transferase AbiEii/AbiGii toxin family protein [Enterocloster clostridioformis]